MPDTVQVRLRTVRHPYLTAIANRVLVEGKRTVPEFLLHEIEPLGLAVWYMDDGSLHTTANKNGTYGRMIRIATCNFQQNEVLSLCRMLQERFAVCGVMYLDKNPRHPESPYPCIRINGEQAERFLQIVRPHMVGAGMDYKAGII